MSDFRCPLRREKGKVRLEWVQVARHGSGWMNLDAGKIDYEIPRLCMEALGIDCVPLDRRDEHGQQVCGGGTYGLRAALDAHRRMQPDTPTVPIAQGFVWARIAWVHGPMTLADWVLLDVRERRGGDSVQ